MKRAWILFGGLLLVLGLAAQAAPAEPEWLEAAAAEGGGCNLPDVAGLSEAEAAAAALAAGFELPEPTAMAPPACPVNFACNSIGNCAAGPLCSLTVLGPCCTTTTGLRICCLSGSIKVTQCPCRCSGSPCAIQCVSSSNLSWSC